MSPPSFDQPLEFHINAKGILQSQKKRYPEAKGIADAHWYVEQGHKKGNVVI
jgi:hypothetical protein